VKAARMKLIIFDGYRIHFPWDGLKATDVDAVLVGEGDLHHTRKGEGGKARR
jgi:hypothetical protein